jgi:ankyrin repeat protein
VRARIGRGEEVNIHDFVGATPLHYAALYAHHNVLSELLQSGAAVDARDNKGKTALHYGVMYDDKGGGTGSRATVKLLLDRGAGVHISDDSGRTPLVGETFVELCETR